MACNKRGPVQIEPASEEVAGTDLDESPAGILVARILSRSENISKKRARQIAEHVLNIEETPGYEEYLEQIREAILDELINQERLRGLLDPTTTVFPPDVDEPFR